VTAATNVSPKTPRPQGLMERLKKSWFPPAAIMGAFSSFVSAAFKSRNDRPEELPQAASLVQIQISPQKAQAPGAPVRGNYEIEYSLALVIGSGNSANPFRRSLSGVCIGPKDRIYALGDGEIRTFEPAGDLLQRWKSPENATCLSVSPEGRVFIGVPGRVEILSPAGESLGGFAVGNLGRAAHVTAIKTFGKEILVADAAARYIRRYDAAGKQVGEIGTQNKTRSFMLPNRSLDMDVDAKGVVRATDSGRHQVTSWVLDGSPLGKFGKFGLSRPEDFVGCCNPVNIALAPDGKIVTAEKVIARVKIYDSNGKLLALIGQENFDQNCTHLYLAVDSRNRIVVADPVRREVKVFSPIHKPGGANRV
jgi:hypothetical protein